jgi:hypothetical protein
MWPIDGYSLELQSDAKVSIREPLTVNNARKSSQITHERTDHQSFIQMPSPLGQDSYSERAYVLRGRSLSRGRVLRAGYFYRNSQPNPFFKPS